MAFGDMFKKKLGAAAQLVEKQFARPAAPAEEEEEPAGDGDGEVDEASAAAGDADAEERELDHDEAEADADDDSDVADDDGSDDADEDYGDDDADDGDTDDVHADDDDDDDDDDDVADEDEDEDHGDGDEEADSGADAGDWDSMDMETFWVHSFALEEAKGKGRGAYAKKLKELGLRDEDHWYEVRDAYTESHQSDSQWQQSMVNARMAGVKQMMSAAANAKGGLLDPVEGVTLEQYATLQVRRAKLTTAEELVGLLAEYGMDEAKWARVDGVFMARMSDPSDPMATAAFATEYGKYFSAASSGQFAAGAKAGAKAMGLKGKHTDVEGTSEPIPFERYVEIMTAQDCWATAGKDVNAMLKKVFNITALDWSNLSAYWSQKMLSNVNMALKLPAMQEKYRPRYAQASHDDDLDV